MAACRLAGRRKEKVMDIITKCPICRKEHQVHLTREQGLRYGDYRAGKGHIQDLLPDLSADDSERLITGICPECFTSLCDEDDE